MAEYGASDLLRKNGGILILPLFLIIIAGLLTLQPKPARACPNCGCVAVAHALMANVIDTEHAKTRKHITDEYENHRRLFFVAYYFKEHLFLSMQMWAEQLTVNAMHQMLILGEFLDAKEHVETFRLWQKLTAEAHKDYHTSTEMCGFGTLARSLGNSQRVGEATAVTLSQRSQARQLLSGNVYPTSAFDKEYRSLALIERHCDPNDNNKENEEMCATPGDADTINMDVNYGYMMSTLNTINADLLNNTTANNEADVFALTANLYGHDIIDMISQDMFDADLNHELMLDLRSVMAKRSVAENSFASQMGMQVRGSSVASANQKYMGAVLEQLGVTSQDEVDFFLGEAPSYNAQMEVLTKVLFQRPQFYINLYDKPTNIDRKAAAIRAIMLMQNMDRWKSQLRSESVLSVLLETELLGLDSEVQNTIGRSN
jgi:hypothetical protein